jgi:hypothetical protein
MAAGIGVMAPDLAWEGKCIMRENPFVGVWNLVSCDAVRRNGGALPIYGKNPVGRLYYDAAGNMSVHIMEAGRPAFMGATKFRAAASEMRIAYEGYEAYFSNYTIDAARDLISHNVIGSLFPNWTGTIQNRFYQFETEDRLLLSTTPIGAPPDGEASVMLVWERIE